MSTIKISQLSAVGSELFDDSESFLHELADSEFVIMGGHIVSQPNTPISPGISICTIGSVYWKSGRCFESVHPITKY